MDQGRRAGIYGSSCELQGVTDPREAELPTVEANRLPLVLLRIEEEKHMQKATRTMLLVMIALLLSGTLVFAGAQGEKETKKAITIGYCSPGLDAFQAGVMYSVIRYANQKGWAVITEDANRDSQLQANQVEYLISLGVKAIVAVPEDSQAFGASVLKARQANIPVYTIDRAPIGVKVNMTVQADNVTAGTQSGTEVVKFLTAKYGSPKGTVLELQGEMSQNVAQLRH